MFLSSAEIAILILQLLNMFLLVAWIGLAIHALTILRRSQLSTPMLLIGMALVVLVPVLGALAVVIVRPDQRAPRALLPDQARAKGFQPKRDVVREARRR